MVLEVEKRKKRKFKSFSTNACQKQKLDYFCTPLNSETRITNEWFWKLKKEKKESLKVFSQTLVRNENLITFATPKQTSEGIKKIDLKRSSDFRKRVGGSKEDDTL